ncbi:glutathione S-transferase [Parvularcula sp. ZS-1/3]|uniref:Glutathione S-transferase n=1 Tax=Parvularcula mediterranea TaxID=2732508 RepID=A0A7Y3RNL3_9PROT|nr:glutathione S-transferase N-terminal domain-containing protein [Parvularcula mediterranea]NNU16871.1 glutathione S-transferase [Parvularcula mediterranea]
MGLTFYDCPPAPSPRRARIALLEKGAEFDTKIVNLAEGEHLCDAYKAINPTCTVPALTIDSGETIGDNHGIIAWLDAAYPENPLLGASPLEKAMVASWSARCEIEGLLAIAEIVRNFAPQMKGRALTGPVNYDQIPQLVERGVARLSHFWGVLDERLEGREFLATDSFSWADVTALVAVDFSKVARQRPGDEYTNLWRWRKSIDERPSVSATNVGAKV